MAETAVAEMAPTQQSSDATTVRRVRKPYTITKSRESWSDVEHEKFLEALQLFDRDWKKIEAFVGTKTVIQIRSHAQKYFLKVQKNGTGEHLPPPRPKRKAAQPYPQKAPKTVLPACPAERSPPSSSSSGSASGDFPATPDFASVYRFIGNVFDPSSSGHLMKLTDMPQIDRETVLLLMRNLATNLSSIDMKDHLKFLSSSVRV